MNKQIARQITRHDTDEHRPTFCYCALINKLSFIKMLRIGPRVFYLNYFLRARRVPDDQSFSSIRNKIVSLYEFAKFLRKVQLFFKAKRDYTRLPKYWRDTLMQKQASFFQYVTFTCKSILFVFNFI